MHLVGDAHYSLVGCAGKIEIRLDWGKKLESWKMAKLCRIDFCVPTHWLEMRLHQLSISLAFFRAKN